MTITKQKTFSPFLVFLANFRQIKKMAKIGQKAKGNPKAFDSFWHQVLFYQLIKNNIEGHDLIKDLNSSTKCAIKLSKNRTPSLRKRESAKGVSFTIRYLHKWTFKIIWTNTIWPICTIKWINGLLCRWPHYTFKVRPAKRPKRATQMV